MPQDRCPFCQRQFKSLLQHLRKSPFCREEDQLARSKSDSETDYEEINDTILPVSGDDCVSFSHEAPDHDERDFMLTGDHFQLQTNLPELPPDAIHNVKESTKCSFTIDPQMEGYIKILCFLDQIQAPLKTFDELMKLLFDLHQHQFNFGCVHKKRQSVMQKIVKTFPIADTQCSMIELEPPIQKRGEKTSPKPLFAPVYRFDIRHQIKDLLADDMFYDVQNLVVNHNKPFSKYIPEDGMVDEIHSGEWYSRTYDEMVVDESTTIILPLKFYCDKTGLDPMMQRHALEPVMFSLTVLNRDVQQNCEKSWRHLGFIPDLEKMPGADKTTTSSTFFRGRSVRNYHRCLDFILEELIELQKTGMPVFLQIGNHYVKRHAYFPVSIFVGDSKSSDNLCCRISHYNQPRMSRACYTSFKECANTNIRCHWVYREDQQKLQKQLLDDDAEENEDLLQEIRDVSTYRCWSSMFQLDFGANPHGQFLACTVDPMHMFEGGWVAMVCKAFVASLSSGLRNQLNKWALSKI
jgi:hypothetical protein